MFIPDLLVVCDPAKISKRGIEGAPDLVVEILSPSTAGKDVTRKWWAYEAAGIPEYLIVDPDERVGRLLRLEGGRYEEAARVEFGGVVALLGSKLSVTLGWPGTSDEVNGHSGFLVPRMRIMGSRSPCQRNSVISVTLKFKYWKIARSLPIEYAFL